VVVVLEMVVVFEANVVVERWTGNGTGPLARLDRTSAVSLNLRRWSGVELVRLAVRVEYSMDSGQMQMQRSAEGEALAEAERRRGRERGLQGQPSASLQG
jgi:hypothetical protein